MPRLTTRAILEASKYDRLLPLLLRECRSLSSAIGELRWLQERAQRVVSPKPMDDRTGGKQPPSGWRRLLKSMCKARSRGVPLQYILGDQPFGELDIKCTKGVLIPRHETEAITFYTAKLIQDRMSCVERDGAAPLRILDLCTGTGCISLLLHSLLSPYFPRLSIVGVDISATAIRLAKENVERNVRLGSLSERALNEVDIQHGDVLGLSSSPLSKLEDLFDRTTSLSPSSGPHCDVIISNPPYVSVEEYHDGTTSRSVRLFEPKLALVPPESTLSTMVESKHVRREDIFYYHIACLATLFKAKMTVLECGSRSQAERVATLCKSVIGKHGYWSGPVLVDVWSVTGFDTGPSAVIVYSPS
ncbi:S-adenosyl-L-methionine-dependent methyltransferase [Aspergillus foveolatus]|uniref:S-adenosyl-L-methionine-dependent methyltransferase n=1 Tax=Aspergillus foveolatus TaxID=210207 RepID=UPI003CCDA5E9